MEPVRDGRQGKSLVSTRVYPGRDLRRAGEVGMGRIDEVAALVVDDNAWHLQHRRGLFRDPGSFIRAVQHVQTC